MTLPGICTLLVLFKDTPRTKPYKLTIRSTLGFCLINSGGVKSSSLSAEITRSQQHFQILHNTTVLTDSKDAKTNTVQLKYTH
jgi:hypothetical protein